MVTLPPEFVATAYPGYFWNVLNRKLYSIKRDGILKPIQYTKPSRFTDGREGYRVSVKGQRRWMTLPYLLSLPIKDTQIPVNNNKEEPNGTNT